MARSGFDRKPRVGEYLWHGLCRGMRAVYGAVGRAWPGRILTAYRKAEGSLSGACPSSADICRPVSPSRRRLMEAMERGWIPRILKGLFGGLWRCPLACYGLFGLLYSLGMAASLVWRTWHATPRIWPVQAFVLCGVLAAAFALLLTTRCSLGESLGRSRLMRLLLVRYLCIPADQLTGTGGRRLTGLSGVLSALFGLLAAVGAAYGGLPLIAVPLILPALGACGLIFSTPEVGVVLSTALLPFVWLERRAVYFLCGLILVTWCAYGVKLLCLHRSFHLGLLDRVLLIFGGYMLLSAFIGTSGSMDTRILSLMPVILLTDYFLIVNLMTTRAYIRRCLLGVAVSVVIVTGLAYLSRVSVDTLDWMAGSRAGDAIIAAFRDAVEGLSGLWQEHAEIYLVLVFPWLFAYLMHTRLPTRRVMGLLLLAVDVGLILMTRSITATVCVAVVTVLFVLLLGPKWAAAGAVTLPVASVGAVWLLDRFPISEAFMITLSRSRHFKEQLRGSLWRMVADYPAGIGVGEDAFTAVYPAYAAPDLGAVTSSGSLFFEILVSYGWPGLLLLGAVVFFFFQKSFTCLGCTAARRDRAMLLGGVVSMCGVLVFGIFRSFLTVPRVFFTLTLVLALCSAYENIIFREYDVLMATDPGTSGEQDRIFRYQ